MLDYHGIKKLAKEIGCNVPDLLALSNDNDPFYIGPARRRQAEWFAEQWISLRFKEGSHLRRLHYILISQTSPIVRPFVPKKGAEPIWIPYQNTENDWSFLAGASLAARYLKLIPVGALNDHRNDEPIVNAYNHGRRKPHAWTGNGDISLQHTIDRTYISAPYLFTDDASVSQRYLVEVWIEKSTQNDILEPLARNYGFNLVSGIGETSEIRTREAFDRIISDSRPARILYISDFDPAGRSMPVAMARKLEYCIREAERDVDVTLNPIALTPEQCINYRLPRTPLKETELRAAKFEERFGEGATELDALEALHPGELAKIVRAEVERYVDGDLNRRVADVSSAFSRRADGIRNEIVERYDVDGFKERYDAIIDEYETGLEEDVDRLLEDMRPVWRNIADELRSNLPEFEGELPGAKIAEEPSAPLFDSKRDYLSQIDHYRAWQGKDAA